MRVIISIFDWAAYVSISIIDTNISLTKFMFRRRFLNAWACFCYCFVHSLVYVTVVTHSLMNDFDRYSLCKRNWLLPSMKIFLRNFTHTLSYFYMPITERYFIWLWYIWPKNGLPDRWYVTAFRGIRLFSRVALIQYVSCNLNAKFISWMTNIAKLFI